MGVVAPGEKNNNNDNIVLYGCIDITSRPGVLFHTTLTLRTNFYEAGRRPTKSIKFRTKI